MAHRLRVVTSIPVIPRVTLQQGGIIAKGISAGRARPAGIFPFRFSGQAVAVVPLFGIQKQYSHTLDQSV